MRGFCVIIPLALIGLLAAPQWTIGDGPAAHHLVGIWRAQIPTAWGLGMAETVLTKDGRFTKTFRVGQMLIWDSGKYTIGQGYIHFDIKDHEPKIYKGKPMSWVKSETVFYQMMGPDRMSCEDRITGAHWEAFRVR